jgi:hypothetical protein
MPETGTTTPETLESRRSGISLALLPKTMRDAILVTRSLGISFIWIDSLCIIQGDADDWGRESGTMSQVYSRAIVTIAAGLWDHCDGGFIGPEKVKLRDKLRMWNPPMDETEKRILRLCFRENPLSRRGWTLQERELSTRIISFTGAWTIWECRQQCLVYRVSSRHKPRCLEPGSFEEGRCLDRIDYASWRGFNPHILWRDLVMDYTRRQFTKPTDKLAALAGLADAMQPLMKSEYLAGMWSRPLIDDLLWFRDKEEETHAPFESYYAPSWSWLSTNFVVRYPTLGYMPPDYMSSHTERVIDETKNMVIETTLVSNGHHSFSGGFIRLRTQVRSLLEAGAPKMLLHFDDQSPALVLRKIHFDQARTDFDHPRMSQMRRGCVVCKIRTIRFGTKISSPYFGLILECTQEDTNIYKRIGMAADIPAEWLEGCETSEIVIV